MRKLWFVLLLLTVLCTPACMAEDNAYLGTMEVVNCNEWVSLREAASVESTRLAKVPLGAWLSDCIQAENGFVRVQYNDMTGYIRQDYLAVASGAPEVCWEERAWTYDALVCAGDEVFRYEQADALVVATRSYEAGERLHVGCFRPDRTPVWGLDTGVNDIYELDNTAIFMGGDGDYQQVLVYNSMLGLTALDLYDGSMNWQLRTEQVALGASILHAVGPDGAIYIAGYYGPDPVGISKDGDVLFTCDVGSQEIYWPYRMVLEGDELQVDYESSPAEHMHYKAVFDLQGNLRWSNVVSGDPE